jgi:hypothetical protein
MKIDVLLGLQWVMRKSKIVDALAQHIMLSVSETNESFTEI